AAATQARTAAADPGRAAFGRAAASRTLADATDSRGAPAPAAAKAGRGTDPGAPAAKARAEAEARPQGSRAGIRPDAEKPAKGPAQTDRAGPATAPSRQGGGREGI